MSWHGFRGLQGSGIVDQLSRSAGIGSIGAACCGLFGLGSFVAGGLGWGCCWLRIFWCDWLHRRMWRQQCFWLGLFVMGDFRLERPGILACGICGSGFGFLFFLGMYALPPYGHVVHLWGLCWITWKQTIPSLMIFKLSFKALQMLNIIKWRIFIEEEGHACEAPGSWGGPLGPHIDAMCVVVCGTYWLCIWLGVSYDWGSHLVRKVSYWHDAGFLLEFSSFLFVSFFCLPKDYVLIIKNLKVKCCTTCPRHWEQVKNICK